MLPETKEFRLGNLPGYEDWSRERREEYPEVFAVLDSMTVLLAPEELDGAHHELFSELYEEALSDFGLDVGDEATFDLED